MKGVFSFFKGCLLTLLALGLFGLLLIVACIAVLF